MTDTKTYDFTLPKGGDIIDFMMANKLVPKDWNGLDSLFKYPRKVKVRKKLRQVINDHAEAVPKEWTDNDPWLKPSMDIIKDEPHKPPTLPLEHFGEFWTGIIKRNAKAKSTAVDFVATALLVATASLIGNARRGAPTPDSIRQGLVVNYGLARA